jgi:hypothetical protein
MDISEIFSQEIELGFILFVHTFYTDVANQEVQTIISEYLYESTNEEVYKDVWAKSYEMFNDNEGWNDLFNKVRNKGSLISNKKLLMVLSVIEKINAIEDSPGKKSKFKVPDIIRDIVSTKKDEPIEYLLSFNSQCFVTGEFSKEVSIEELAIAIVSGKKDYEEYIDSTETEWRNEIRNGDLYGPTTLVDCILNPGGSRISIDLDEFYPEESEPQDGDKNIGKNGSFTEFRFIIDKGIMEDYTLDLYQEFDLKYLKPVFKEHSLCGIISHYEYENKVNNDSEFFIESELVESRPTLGGGIYLFHNTEQGLKQLWNFDELKNEMKSKKIDIKINEVVKFLKEYINE